MKRAPFLLLCTIQANATRALLSSQEKREHNLAVMLLVVVLIFFICNIWALIINVLEHFGTENQQPNQQLIQVKGQTGERKPRLDFSRKFIFDT